MRETVMKKANGNFVSRRRRSEECMNASRNNDGVTAIAGQYPCARMWNDVLRYGDLIRKQTTPGPSPKQCRLLYGRCATGQRNDGSRMLNTDSVHRAAVCVSRSHFGRRKTTFVRVSKANANRACQYRPYDWTASATARPADVDDDFFSLQNAFSLLPNVSSRISSRPSLRPG